MFLSICIPSYNRFEKLYETLNNILEAKSDLFEVIIIDNCSPRNIESFLPINDRRLKIIKRSKAVSGIKNVFDCLFYGEGKYKLLLLDKDYILGKNLDRFINILSKENVCGGYCDINSKNFGYEIIEKNVVKKFGFLDKHPSGDFFRSDILLSYIKDKKEKLQKDIFSFDICLAGCAANGAMLHYKEPLIFSSLEQVDSKDKIKSLSFSKEKANLFFLPQNRIEQFITYLSYLKDLDISNKEKEEVLKTLYFRTAENITYSYKSIMSNEVICNHYRIDVDNITDAEMKKNLELLKKYWFKQSIVHLSVIKKYYLNFLLNRKFSNILRVK